MQTREWILTAAVIVVPLIIAVVVTLWSLDQVRYRPKKRRPASVARETVPPPVSGGPGGNVVAGRAVPARAGEDDGLDVEDTEVDVTQRRSENGRERSRGG